MAGLRERKVNYNRISFKKLHGVYREYHMSARRYENGAIYDVAITTVISSRVKITCYFHVKI